MNSIFTIRSTPFARTTVFFILVVLLSQLALPILGQGIVEAQAQDPLGCSSRGLVFIDNGVGGGNCGTQADLDAINQQAAATTGGGGTSSGSTCSGVGFLWNFGVCVGRFIAVWSGALMIWISGWFLGAAGVIFNWGIENTVVNFNGVVYTNVAGGIQAVWTAFRDISNILIIGILVFVAIEMILGTSAFGGKKTVAKVLVIAILINFSLLFSRMIVETANFVSGQFYKAVQFQTSGGSGGAISTAAGSNAVNQYSSGISGRFAQLMGVTGFASSGEALWKTAEDPKNGGFIALGQGTLTALVFLAAAAVFFYGTFLMISRAILLIFLIMTSSLAFASYLLPKNLTGNYGWSAWWKSLLQSAVFGPLLLIFLWATLKVAEGIARIPGTGEIGTLISSPADIGGIAALFGYLIILGMLFASIKIASSFAKGIAGFSYAAVIPAMGYGIAGRIIGATGRQTVGRVFQGAADAAKSGSQSTRLPIGMRKALDITAQQLRKGAKANYNPLKASLGGVSLGTEIQKVTAGFKKLDSLAGKDIGGFEGAMKKRAEAIAEQAERMTPKPNSDEGRKTLERARNEAAGEEVGKNQKEKKANLDAATENLAKANQAEKKASEDFAAKLKEIQKELDTTRTEPDSADKTGKIQNLENKRLLTQSEHTVEMREQGDRIKRAQEALSRAATAHTEAVKKFDDTVEEKVSVGTMAEKIAKSDTLSRLNASNDMLAKAARDQVGEKKQKDTWKKQLAALKSVEEPAAPAAAPTPPPPPPPAH